MNKTAKQRLSKKQTEGFIANKKIDVIKLLERSLGICMARAPDKLLAQEICVLIWNASVPLLQGHLRLRIYTALKAVAVTLEAVGSSLAGLRAQMHYEISKCEEQSDFVSIAKDEGYKAVACDYGEMDEQPYQPQPPTWSSVPPTPPPELDHNRPLDLVVRPFVEVLELRAGVFASPTDIEGKIFMYLQQTRETKSKEMIRNLLKKSILLILPAITPMEDGEEVNLEVDSLSEIGGPTGEVPQVDLETLKAAIVPGTAFTDFTKLIHKRMLILSQVAAMAQALKCSDIVQNCVTYMLSHHFNPEEKILHFLIRMQIQSHYLLAESLVERLSKYALPKRVDGSPFVIDPRSLGIQEKYASEEMMMIKNLIVTSLLAGVQLSLTIKSSFLLQNGIIYFWNMHLHVFRGGLYDVAMPEVMDFLTEATVAMEQLADLDNSGIDDRLQLILIEAKVSFFEVKQQVPQAMECATKACSIPNAIEYNQKKLAEVIGRLTIAGAPAAGAGGKGGKGGGGGGGGGASEIPKYDSVFLSIFGALAQAEQPAEVMPLETSVPLTARIVEMMDKELQDYLQALDMDDLTQERYSQLIEMQVEAWSRLTRLRVIFSDTIGAQHCADCCMKLIDKENLTKYDEDILTTRVWRWISVCKRLLGITIANIIQPEGQDETLQNELRLAAMVHFTSATDYAIKAENQQLVLDASNSAWSVSMHMIELTDLRSRLFEFQRRIMNNLLRCSGVGGIGGIGGQVGVDQEVIFLLRQQYYLAMVQGFAMVFDWVGCLKMVMEAFEHVPSHLQKPLWRWRVVAMSKRGKNVLDGLQKLKENNTSLQAQVFGVLARSSTSPKQQLESYVKAIEVLSADLERVDYMLECSQFMASAGLPKQDIMQMLLSATDALYEVEEYSLPAEAPETETEVFERPGSPSDQYEMASNSSGFESARSASRANSMTRKSVVSRTSSEVSAASSTRQRTQTASISSAASGIASKESSKKTKAAERQPAPVIPPPLNIKQLEQVARGLAMIAILESKEAVKAEKCVELIHFLQKAQTVWVTTLRDVHRKSTYDALTDEEKEVQPYNDEYIASVEIPLSMSVLLSPDIQFIDLLKWQKDEAFVKAMEGAMASKTLCELVVSPHTLPLLSLTFYYFMKVVTILHDAGFTKHALTVLGWMRLVLMNTTPAPAGVDAALVQVQLRTIELLRSVGLFSEAAEVPHGLRSDPALTVADYVSQFMRQVALKEQSSKVVVKEDCNTTGTSGPFGLYTWTSTFDSSTLNVNLCLLNTIPILLRAGQVQLAQTLVLALWKEFVQVDDKASLLECGTYANTINLVNGRYADVTTSILNLQSTLNLAGDSTRLCSHTVLLIQAYMKIGKIDDGKLLAAAALQRIEEMALFTIDKRMADKTRLAGTSSKFTGLPTKSETVARQVSFTPSTDISVKARASVVTEANFENVVSLVEVLMVYTDLLVEDGIRSASEKGDVKGVYMDICDNLGRTYDLVCDTAGPLSAIGATVLTKRATAVCAFLLKIHEHSISCGIPEESYSAWLKDNILLCVEYLEKVVRIRKEIDSRVPAEGKKYATVEMMVAAATVTTGATHSEKAVTPQPYVELSLLTSRNLGLSHCELAGMEILSGMTHGKHESVTLHVVTRHDMTIAEQYIEITTKPPPEFDLAFFNPSIFHKAANRSLEAMRLLKGTDFASDADLLQHTGVVLNGCADGCYDSMWKGPDEDQEPVPEEMLTVREMLANRARSLIATDRVKYIPYACVALTEAFGPNTAAYSAAWIMQMQSCSSMKWLEHVWLETLNQASEISASYARLMNLKRQSLPSMKQQQQIAAESSFLESISVPFKRLSIAADPLQIFNTLPTGMVTVCMQLDPTHDVLYVCAGYVNPKQKPSTVADAVDNKMWFMSKMKFSETQRRHLQQLRRQHKAWTADMTKFVAAYGEISTPMFDVEGASTNFKNSKSCLAQETGLTSRLEELVEEMEEVFKPVFSADGALRMFLDDAVREMTGGGVHHHHPSVMLLIDMTLQSLPWEAMSCLSAFKEACCRDFSIHMVSHRIQCAAGNKSTATDSESGISLVLPTHPSITVSAGHMTYVVDPLVEDMGTKAEGMERDSMTEVTKHAIDKDVIKDGKRWTNLKKGNGFVTLEDWLKAADKSSMSKEMQASSNMTGLFTYTLGRFGSLVASTEVSVMNLEKLALLIFVDQGHNDVSYRRQVSGDTLKTPKEIEMETPLNLAAICSLAGAQSMFMHQWSTPFAAQNRLIRGFMKDFSNKKGSVVTCMAGAGRVEEGGEMRDVKKWVKYARVVYGLPNVEYAG